MSCHEKKRRYKCRYLLNSSLQKAAAKGDPAEAAKAEQQA